MAAAATLAHSVPLGKRPRTDRRSVADRRSEVSGMEKKGNFKVLSSLLSVNPGRREVSEALSQTPRSRRASTVMRLGGGRSPVHAEGFTT